jgi:hypothetical protein
MAGKTDEKLPGNTVQWGTKVPTDAGQTGQDRDREEVRRELKSDRFDPNTAPPRKARKHPTEGEKAQFGDAAPSVAPGGERAPSVVPGDDAILPDRGKRVPESLRGASHNGVLDPPEAGHPLPEGLERKPARPLNKDTGRRIKGGGGG